MLASSFSCRTLSLRQVLTSGYATFTPRSPATQAGPLKHPTVGGTRPRSAPGKVAAIDNRPLCPICSGIHWKADCPQYKAPPKCLACHGRHHVKDCRKLATSPPSTQCRRCPPGAFHWTQQCPNPTATPRPIEVIQEDEDDSRSYSSPWGRRDDRPRGREDKPRGRDDRPQRRERDDWTNRNGTSKDGRHFRPETSARPSYTRREEKRPVFGSFARGSSYGQRNTPPDDVPPRRRETSWKLDQPRR